MFMSPVTYLHIFVINYVTRRNESTCGTAHRNEKKYGRKYEIERKTIAYRLTYRKKASYFYAMSISFFS